MSADDRSLLEAAARAAGKRERHGMNKTPEHRAWVHMKQRCTNPKKREWPYYGGKGVKVCDEWMRSFVAFLRDVGRRPSYKHSIDRIDVSGHYEPGNVRWATHQEQIENTTVARFVTIDGERKTISAWERERGLPRGTVRRRESSGWPLVDAIMTPAVAGQKVRMRVKRDYSNRTRDGHGRYRPESA